MNKSEWIAKMKKADELRDYEIIIVSARGGREAARIYFTYIAQIKLP